MNQRNINSPDCEPSFIGLVVKPHEGLFNFSDMDNKKALYMMQWRRTVNGLISTIYHHQKSHSKTKGYALPNYSKEDLIKWVLSQSNFKILYDNWAKSDYKRYDKPSCDRINDYKSYTLDNLQLMTWKQNESKGHSDRKKGINNKSNKSVIQYDTSLTIIKEYHSLTEAERQTGVNHSNISACCLQKYGRKTLGGFIWKYKFNNKT